MTRVKLILDTTYILPLFGVDVSLSKGYEPLLVKMLKNGIPRHDIIVPHCCLLEAYYKLNREFRHAMDPSILQRYTLAIPTIVNSPILRLLDPIINPACTEIASKIRKLGHLDVIDCLIAATVISLDGMFLTEDGDLATILVDNGLVQGERIKNWAEIRVKI